MQQSTVQQAKIIWFVLMSAPLLFFGITNIIDLDIKMSLPPFIFIALGIFMSIFLGIVAQILYNNKCKEGRKLRERADKENAYVQAKVLQGSILEGAGLLTTVFYLFTQNQLLIAVLFAVLVQMFFQMPSEEGFKRDMKV